MAPKSWSAPLAAGSAQSSYYQGSGDFVDPNQVFDLASTSAEVPEPEPELEPDSSVVQQPDASQQSEGSDAVEPSDGDTTVPEGATPTEDSLVTEGGTVTIDYERPNGTTDKRVVS